MSNNDIINELNKINSALNQLAVVGVQNCNIVSFIDVKITEIIKSIKNESPEIS